MSLHQTQFTDIVPQINVNTAIAHNNANIFSQPFVHVVMQQRGLDALKLHMSLTMETCV